ncbi:unnamed protein product [Anisakis simplex]|uniref:Uncharacterized protein n=1 Tax=Anisakis simplex TaxID=6269 RepID=A0A3P6QG76_ANISI|nr:unnamed protein product [Anisakis simplex]
MSEGPSDNIGRVLVGICKSLDMRQSCTIPGRGQTQRWDLENAARMFLDLFRKGKLKDHCLDRELLLRNY